MQIIQNCDLIGEGVREWGGGYEMERVGVREGGNESINPTLTGH